MGQLPFDEIPIGQLAAIAHAVHQNDFLEALVGGRILDQAHERCQAGAGAQQVQAFARPQIVQQQSARRLAADEHFVAGLDVLQARRQRPVGNLDAEEFQILFVIRAGDAIGAHQRFPLDLQPEHDEVSVLEAQALVARGREAEHRFIPMMHGQDAFRSDRGHRLKSQRQLRLIACRRTEQVSDEIMPVVCVRVADSPSSAESKPHLRRASSNRERSNSA